VQEIGRGPGQREDRYAQLLGGPVELAATAMPSRISATSASPGLEARIEALEEEIAALHARLDALTADKS
jgi:uncharacterized protein YceH (UPF0502 family)